MSLVVAGVVSILTGLSFGLVARAVSRRGATRGSLHARRAHELWWLGLGGYLVVQGALTLMAAGGGLTLGLYLASRALLIPALCAGTWGITSFILYLYRGSTAHFRPLGVLYALVAVLFAWATFGQPQQLFVREWIVTLDDTGALYRLVYVLVGLPPILASVAYLALLPRIEGREQRYRVLLLAGSILAYVGSGLAGRLSARSEVVFVTLVLFGIGAAVASLAAYYPPPLVRRLLRGGAS